MIMDLLNETNPLVKTFRMARDRISNNPNEIFKLKLIAGRNRDGRNYNMPAVDEVAALIVGDLDMSFDRRDILIEKHSGKLKRISELHPQYLALQYPLLFAYAEDGYRPDIYHKDVADGTSKRKIRVSMREFFAYKIQSRSDPSLLQNARKLYQQFLVDAYTMVESERVSYIRNQQSNLRSESYKNLTTATRNGNTDNTILGKRVILPSSFTGSQRYMVQNYLDAMAICKAFGYPDLFLTFTCNPKWPEIVRFLQNKNIRTEDRPDMISRMFKVKLDQLIKDLKENKLFGKIEAVVYTVEFQKRGLPHSHICLFLNAKDKLPDPKHIDTVISAEIPDHREDPDLYKLVSELMIHGPCGQSNKDSPCMREDKCSKKFPKKYTDHTSIDFDGYPCYRRRDNGRTVKKKGVDLDNRYVVGYNPTLLKKYQAHLNVEWCNQLGSIKYLFKYINKGNDRVTAAVCDEEHDEIQAYYDCRYISACESVWRILCFDIHYRTPSVERLPFHLPDEQNVIFSEDTSLEDILESPSVNNTKFLEWMKCNKVDPLARILTYAEFPKHFVWKQDKKKWSRRSKRVSVGRIHHMSPNTGELFYLRILLNHVKGPTSYNDIRMHNGEPYNSFKETCFAMGLLDDDKEYIEAIEEASRTGTGIFIRSLFVMLLLNDSLTRPEFVWEKSWTHLTEDILNRERIKTKRPTLDLTLEQINNLALIDVEKMLQRNGSTLKKFDKMPYPNMRATIYRGNRLIDEELSYNKLELKREHENLFNVLTEEQKNIYQTIITAINKTEGGVFFVYGFGGTGKTFVWKTISAALRSKGNIVLNVASSGIAALLLEGGRTAHSRFAIPINIFEDSLCNITPDSHLAALLRETKLIIWDEAPMVNKHSLEALDRTMRDVLRPTNPRNMDIPFGGKVVVFGGDFRQILPVVQQGSRQDIVNASLKSSYLWKHCKVLKLTVNMRLRTGSNPAEINEIKDFAEWILNIGDGTIGTQNEGDITVQMLDNILINDVKDPVDSLISSVYPHLLENYSNPTYLKDRALLAPRNDVVDEINDHIMDLIPGEEKIYLSSDNICESDLAGDFNKHLYSPEFLNGIKLGGLPNHNLRLKKGVPVMLLRNIDQTAGLCNGTRLQVVNLGERVIEAKIISGNNIGMKTFIPRIMLRPSDKRIPFKFQRRQFPLAVCFAMTVNKSQGQSLSQVGLFLKRPVFTHGQLYVALSRVKSKKGLKVLIYDKEGKVTNTTTNVVYKEVLQDI